MAQLMAALLVPPAASPRTEWIQSVRLRWLLRFLAPCRHDCACVGVWVVPWQTLLLGQITQLQQQVLALSQASQPAPTGAATRLKCTLRVLHRLAPDMASRTLTVLLLRVPPAVCVFDGLLVPTCSWMLW